MKDIYLEEYSSPKAVLTYTRQTAGYGISYLLDHVYGRIYLDVVKNLVSDEVKQRGLRLLEFGCGGGMNLIHLVSMLSQRNIPVKQAVGTDFSPELIKAARAEAGKYLSKKQQDKTSFYVARNETIQSDLAREMDVPEQNLAEAFDLIVGVNTIRYCHRLDKERDYADCLYRMLHPGGACVLIDMNDAFPLFRSRMRNPPPEGAREFEIPTLEDYARPIKEAGFRIHRQENFCWIPHSAGPFLCLAGRIASPLLNLFARRYAMRSLVVAGK